MEEFRLYSSFTVIMNHCTLNRFWDCCSSQVEPRLRVARTHHDMECFISGNLIYIYPCSKTLDSGISQWCKWKSCEELMTKQVVSLLRKTQKLSSFQRGFNLIWWFSKWLKHGKWFDENRPLQMLERKWWCEWSLIMNVTVWLNIVLLHARGRHSQLFLDWGSKKAEWSWVKGERLMNSLAPHQALFFINFWQCCSQTILNSKPAKFSPI